MSEFGKKFGACVTYPFRSFIHRPNSLGLGIRGGIERAFFFSFLLTSAEESLSFGAFFRLSLFFFASRRPTFAVSCLQYPPLRHGQEMCVKKETDGREKKNRKIGMYKVGKERTKA